MKRVAALVLLLGTVVCLLTACGKEDFKCGLCMKNVHSKKHEISMGYGSKQYLCDDCYESWNSMLDYMRNY